MHRSFRLFLCFFFRLDSICVIWPTAVKRMPVPVISIVDTFDLDTSRNGTTIVCFDRNPRHVFVRRPFVFNYSRPSDNGLTDRYPPSSWSRTEYRRIVRGSTLTHGYNWTDLLRVSVALRRPSVGFICPVL